MTPEEKANQKKVLKQLQSARSIKDVAKLLNLPPKDLSYILYKLKGGRENQYQTFSVKKRNGGERSINAPNSALKEVQKRLNSLLQIIYWRKPCVHSFIKNKSILSNAEYHRRKRWVFNLDIKDFFPSINFGRVRGMFLAKPYSLNEKVATIFTQIACYDNQLPQGSPCSPIISNMISSKLDFQLQNFAMGNKCIYSRYGR